MRGRFLEPSIRIVLGLLLLITVSSCVISAEIISSVADSEVAELKSRAKKDPEAQLLLGALYEKGGTVPLDFKEAIHWYKEAAENGLPDAQAKLGELFMAGKGVSKSARDAYFWTKLAAIGGDQTSISAAEQIASTMNSKELHEISGAVFKWVCGHDEHIKADGFVWVSMNDLYKNGITFVHPQYPEKTKQEGIQGCVVFEARIRIDGSIDSLRLIGGHPALIGPATDAVRQWSFKPYLVSGQPAQVVTLIKVNFKLAGG